MTNPAYKFNPVSASYAVAGQRSSETLLNCYCREIGIPESNISVDPFLDSSNWPLSIRSALAKRKVLHVRIPRLESKIVVAVQCDSPTGNYIYLSAIYYKAAKQPWIQLNWQNLSQIIIQDLALKNDQPFNDDLFSQIEDSVNVTAAILEETTNTIFPSDPFQAYLSSEQSLIYGHPFHPAPKSRQGFDSDDLQRYSPEFGKGFPLHYFAVHQDLVWQQSTLSQTCTEIIAEQAPQRLTVGEDYLLIPAHPWQARWLLQSPLIKASIINGKIHDLGTHGKEYYPTSSVRTLYQPDNPYFYKFSLHVRLTNCVRKNAVYELESALQVNRIMSSLIAELTEQFPGVAILEEPAFLSVDLKDEDKDSNREITEGFGLILRGSFGAHNMQDGAVPLLAGALFGNHILGRAYVNRFLSNICARESISLESATEQWFSLYVQQVMYPVLQCYFAYGIVFEPHLQNVVIGLVNDWPSQVFLRDFEGVKLLPKYYPSEKLLGISQRAQESLWYEPELGWKRIAYCLFVNNFCEAIHQLSAGKLDLQQRLWAQLRHHLKLYQSKYGNQHSASLITAVLNGDPFPIKGNLSARFLKQADRAAGYINLANPLGSIKDTLI